MKDNISAFDSTEYDKKITQTIELVIVNLKDYVRGMRWKSMSKYDTLWEYVSQSGKDSFKMAFDEIEKMAGLPIDHSFLTFKKELPNYGYKVGKISMKAQTVEFIKLDAGIL